MALSPTNSNDAFLQEVDEAVRKDQLDNIMQRYGRWILGGAVAALIAFGGYLYWGHRQEIARGEKAEAIFRVSRQPDGSWLIDSFAVMDGDENSI